MRKFVRGGDPTAARAKLQSDMTALKCNPVYEEIGRRVVARMRDLESIGVSPTLSPQQREQNAGAYQECLHFIRLAGSVEAESLRMIDAIEKEQREAEIIAVNEGRDGPDSDDEYGYGSDSQTTGETGRTRKGKRF